MRWNQCCSTVARRRPALRLTLGILPALFAALPLQAITEITPGIILMKTSNTKPTIFTGAISGSTFGPGADTLLDAELIFQGAPVQSQLGTPSLAPADTVVKVDGTEFTGFPQSRSMIIKVLATNLVTAAPLTVTYNGGMNPELWDVKLCVSSQTPPNEIGGILNLVNDCDTAGSFESNLYIRPKLIFTRRRDNHTVTLDAGSTVVIGLVGHGSWSTQSAATPAGIFEVPEGAIIDADCDGTFETELPASSNLIVGVSRVSCNAGAPNQGFEKISPVTHDRNDVLVLEPATRDDRAFNDAALPPDRRFGWALGGLEALGFAAVIVRPRRKSEKEVE